MYRDELENAVEEIEATKRAVSDEEVKNRLETLSSRLQSQAERETTPALGALDRIQNSLAEIAAESGDETVTERLENAREGIFSFLETLDDRGMKQHGWSQNTNTD